MPVLVHFENGTQTNVTSGTQVEWVNRKIQGHVKSPEEIMLTVKDEDGSIVAEFLFDEIVGYEVRKES